MRSTLFAFFFALTLFATAASAIAIRDTVPTLHLKTRISSNTESEFNSGSSIQHPLDSSLHITQLVNPPLSLHYNYLGTNGSATDAQIFSFNPGIFSFTGLRAYSLYVLPADSVSYYHTNKRYSEVNWMQGGFKEQSIQFLHSQNITKTWNVGFDFSRFGLKNFMANSRIFHSKFLFFTSYQSINRRYAFFANTSWTTISNQVNGGLESDSLFVNTTVDNLGIKGLAFRITDASTNYRNRRFYLSQYYTLRNSKDSLAPGVRLNHRISFERITYAYVDQTADSSFYSNFYYDQKTNDTIHSNLMTNRFSISLPAGQRNILPNWNTEYFLKHQIVRYGQIDMKRDWENVSAGGIIQYLTDSSFQLKIAGEIGLNGQDKGNVYLNGRISLPPSKIGSFSAGMVTGKSSADYIYSFLASNNFKWENNFNSIRFVSIDGQYELPKLKFSLSYKQHLLDNWVYMNSASSPEQTNTTVHIEQFSLTKNFTFRSLHQDNEIIWQNSSAEIIRLPKLILSHSLYLEKRFFNKALLANIGFNAAFNTAYYSNSFMPSNSLFYLQNEIKTGGYTRMDLFINLKIKTARIFIEMENIADNLTGNSYFLTPHYPMPGRILKWGIVWRFFDE